MTAGLEHTWVAHYAKGVPAEIEPPDSSLVDLLTGAVTTYGDRPALEFFGAELSYSELGRQVDVAAEGLRRLGVRPGDRVALVLPNCPEHIVAFYAVLRLGAVVVEHNPLYTPTEMAHQFGDHGATVAIAWDRMATTITALPGVEHVVAVDITASMPWTKRLALRLPVARARALRAQLPGPAPGTTAWSDVVRHGPLAPSTPGPTVDDLARAIASQPVWKVSTPRPVTLDGVRATYLEIELPARVDPADCVDQSVSEWEAGQDGMATTQSFRSRWWILEVDGQRLLVQGRCYDTCTQRDMETLTAMAKSVTFRRK